MKHSNASIQQNQFSAYECVYAQAHNHVQNTLQTVPQIKHDNSNNGKWHELQCISLTAKPPTDRYHQDKNQQSTYEIAQLVVPGEARDFSPSQLQV